MLFFSTLIIYYKYILSCKVLYIIGVDNSHSFKVSWVKNRRFRVIQKSLILTNFLSRRLIYKNTNFIVAAFHGLFRESIVHLSIFFIYFQVLQL